MDPRSALWTPAVVLLAYLPDIVTQVGLLAGWNEGRLLGHSVAFAVTAAAVAAGVLMPLVAVSFARAYLVSLLSLLVHDILDLAQATDRAPWWPLSDRPVSFNLALIPTDILREAGLFGGVLWVFLALRYAAQRRASQTPGDPAIPAGGQTWRVWLGWVFIGAVVLAAVVTHSLRDARDSQFETARALIEQRAYQAGLDALTGAERWPSNSNPGRIDYLRAEAYAGMGDRQRAEAYYLRAYRADPTYFWTIADLALFYASSDEPLAERRRLAEPYLDRLRTDFTGHPALLKILVRLERKLGRQVLRELSGTWPQD